MKLIVAIIRPDKLEAVRSALDQQDVCLIAVGQVQGYGAEPGHREIYRGREFIVRPARLRLELAVDDWLCEGVVEAIVRAGLIDNHGHREDGKVLVLPLEECVSIRHAAPDAVAAGNWRGHAYRAR
jgi:nitrogen regulatory protein PII